MESTSTLHLPNGPNSHLLCFCLNRFITLDEQLQYSLRLVSSASFKTASNPFCDNSLCMNNKNIHSSVTRFTCISLREDLYLIKLGQVFKILHLCFLSDMECHLKSAKVKSLDNAQFCS